jgi:hypothetical protein
VILERRSGISLINYIARLTRVLQRSTFRCLRVITIRIIEQRVIVGSVYNNYR